MSFDLAATNMKHSQLSPSGRRSSWDIRLLSFETGGAHPQAVKPVLELKAFGDDGDTVGEIDFSRGMRTDSSLRLDVHGCYVAALADIVVNEGHYSELCIWNWKTGSVVLVSQHNIFMSPKVLHI